MAADITLAEALGVLDAHYDPRWAAEWDAVGLVTGDPDQAVRRVLLAVDPTQAVLDEAVDWGADLLITHHPLLLRGVHALARTHPKGRAVTTLVRAGIALFVAHTNADVALPGVNDALAGAFGLVDLSPLVPSGVGAPGPTGGGLGRVGRWPAGGTLAEFGRHVAGALPRTAAGVRVAGDLDAPVRRVAVCGGAGDDLFDTVREAGVDAYVTADLRHHPASEAREHGRPALVDVSHWASEWPWLASCEEVLREGITAHDAGRAASVTTRVSRLVTDPWTAASTFPDVPGEAH